MYDRSTKQDDCTTVYGFEADRDPGQEFHGDYSISYGFGKTMRLGLSGYYYIQSSDDDYHLGNNIPGPVQRLIEKNKINCLIITGHNSINKYTVNLVPGSNLITFLRW